MPTVGRRYSGPRRNWNAVCDICGVTWPRSEMVLDADNLLRCPDDQGERSKLELAAQSAANASEPTIVRGATRER